MVAFLLSVTSPPYWKQGDYGFEGRIGQEKTPEEYIGKLRTIFGALKDKLTDDGVFY
jgi:DNA methylase.